MYSTKILGVPVICSAEPLYCLMCKKPGSAVWSVLLMPGWVARGDAVAYDGGMRLPGKVEVLAWMERTGGGPTEAVEHFAPRLPDDEKRRFNHRIRQWVCRERKRRAERDASRVEYIEPRVRQEFRSEEDFELRWDLVDMPWVDRYRWMAAEVLRDVDILRARGQIRDTVPVLKIALELLATVDYLEHEEGEVPSAPEEIAARLLPLLEELAG